MSAAAARVDTAVVGGGAAGMVAAITAARAGRRTAVVEGNERLGRKILISGNGRCNLTNLDADGTVHYHGGDPSFTRAALARFGVEASLAFFRELGIETKEEKRRRLFPVSDQAHSVVAVLADEMARLGVAVRLGTRATGLQGRPGGGFCLTCEPGPDIEARQVVMASGGVSVARLGADASGMDLVQGLGHARTALLPGLVPLLSPDRTVQRMHGVRVWARVRADVPGRRPPVEEDDLLFTRYGVSGFTILNLSARVVPHLGTGPVDLRISLFPGRTAEQVSAELKERWERHGHRSVALSFAGLLHSRVAEPLIHHLGLSPERRVSSLSKAERWRLAQGLTDWRVAVTQPHSFDHAEVTIGGVETADINPGTLESYLAPGLYFAGEMVDVHGDLGGYNFQWAWSSGHLAGSALGS